mgnify:CR=1 FL=1
MSDTRERAGAAGVVVAGTFFKIVLYICVIVLLFWVGKASYQFGHDVFNQQAMSPGEGQEVTVVIKEDTSLYKIAKTLQTFFLKSFGQECNGILCSGKTVHLSWKASGRNVSVKYSIYT